MSQYLGRQNFPPWVPDQSDQLPGVSVDVQNVIPTNSGWAPFPSFNPFTSALPAQDRGFFYGRNSDGSVTIFAGTINKLWVLNNTTLVWTDASKGGGTYTNLVPNRSWEFEQFNNTIIACQGLANPQAFTLGVSTAFADLAGNPPQADFVAVVNRFLMLSGIPANPYRVQWSDLDNITQWTAGVGQSDFQDLPDGGRTLPIAGFDLYAVVFQDQMARLMTYAPGSPVIFTITKITGGDGNGLFAPDGWVIDQDNVFWISQEGFKMLSPGGAPQPIGKEMVDRYYFNNVDTSNLQLTIANTDPAASRLYIGFKSTAGQSGLFDIILIYDWRLQRWSRAFASGQYLTTMARPGSTLEGMDLPTPGAVSISGFASGQAQIAPVTLLSNSGFATQNSGVATAAIPTGTAIGSGVVITLIPVNVSATISALTDSAGNTYTRAIRSGGTDDAEIWYNAAIANAIVGGTTTLTATTSAGPYGIATVVGVVGGLTLDKTASTTGSGTTLSLSTATLSSAAELIVGIVSFDEIPLNSYTETTGFTDVLVTKPFGVAVAQQPTITTAGALWTPQWSPGGTYGAALATFSSGTTSANAVRVTVSSTAGMATAQQQTVFNRWNIAQAVGNAALYTAIYNVYNNIAAGGSGWGQWAINIVDGTHVDLIGSVWNGSITYTSGGVLGGNIELIPFSFDTVSSGALPSLSIFNSNNVMGFFNGPNLQATIETNEAGTPENRMWIEGFRVISDAPTVFGNVSFRDQANAPYTYTTEVGLDGFTGTILVAGGGVDSRYSRIRIRIPAGTAWTYALAVEPIGETTGRY